MAWKQRDEHTWEQSDEGLALVIERDPYYRYQGRWVAMVNGNPLHEPRGGRRISWQTPEEAMRGLEELGERVLRELGSE
jgi:hypothetical protein